MNKNSMTCDVYIEVYKKNMRMHKMTSYKNDTTLMSRNILKHRCGKNPFSLEAEQRGAPGVNTHSKLALATQPPLGASKGHFGPPKWRDSMGLD